MEITAQDVAKLRKMTGAGMMDCKKALVEANGDFEKAQDIIREKGKMVAAKRADRATSEGAVIAKVSEDHKHVRTAYDQIRSPLDVYWNFDEASLPVGVCVYLGSHQVIVYFRLYGETVADVGLIADSGVESGVALKVFDGKFVVGEAAFNKESLPC